MAPSQFVNTATDNFIKKKPLKDISIVQSGSCIDIKFQNITMPSETDLRIYYVTSGKGTITSGKKTYIIQQNDVIFQTRQTPLFLSINPPIPMEVWWVDLCGTAIPSLLDIFNNGSPIIKGVYNPRFLQELKNVITHYDSLTSADYFHIASSLSKIIAILIDCSANSHWVSVTHDNPSILYTETWEAWPSSNIHEEYYTAIPKAYAEFNFVGTGIKWYGTVNFDCGKADIIIDGNYVTTVDTYSPLRLHKQLLYINTQLSYGPHIIKIFCTGSKNDKATNCDVVIESFEFVSIYDTGVPKQKNSTISQTVHKAIELINANQNSITISELAKRLNINRSYLSTKFTQEVGMSPSQYITQVRLESAKKMLIETDLPINKIATDLGYNDVFYFSKSFKIFEKVTPSQYRKLNIIK